MKYDDLLEVKFEKNRRDCKWLCGEMYKRLGRRVPDWDGAVKRWTNEELNKEVNRHRGKFTVINKPVPYCFVLFFIRPYFASHIGIVLEDCRRFIHILEESGVTVERLDKPEWKHRIVGFYTYG